MSSLSRLALAAALLCGAAHADHRGDQEPQSLPKAPTLPILFAEGAASRADEPSFFGRASGFLAAFHRDRIELVRDDAAKSARIALRFAGAATTPVSEELAPGKLNYLVGDRSQWRQNISLHAALRYRALWPGVDLVVHGRAGELQYDLHFAPGTSLDAVGFRIDGASAVRVDERGALVMTTPLGEMVQQAPLTWEVAADGSREVVPSRFVLREDGSYGFAVQRLDASRPLIVDPVLVWGTYLGASNSNEIVHALDVDASGAVYIAGTCGWPFGYETPGAYRTSATSGEGFLAKLDPSQTGAAQVQWLTYIGGSGGDSVRAMVRRPSGTFVVAGEEESGNGSGLNGLLTANAYATTGASFLAEISADGSSLLYGTRCDFVVRHLKLEASGVLVMAGNATQFPLRFATTTPGSFQPVKNAASDIWLARFDMSLSGSAQLLWASYFGSAGDEEVSALVSSPTEPGVFTIAGYTSNAASFPTTHSSGQLSLNDVFVARLDTQQTGSAQLRFSHLYGRFSGPFGEHDAAGGIAFQPDGSFWISVASGYAQLLRFSSDGASLLETWTWYGAGAHGDLHYSDDGMLTLVGSTVSIPSTPGAVQPGSGGGRDLTVVQLEPVTQQILYATHLGGAGDEGYEFGSSRMRGNVLTLAGYTRGGTPILNAIQPTHAGGCCLREDVYLARLELPFGHAAAPGIGPRDVELLDLDGDGDLDVATANETSDNVGLYVNDGLGALAIPVTVSLAVADLGPVALSRGDLDGDGARDDLAIACQGSSTLAYLTNPLGLATASSMAAGGLRPSSVACGALDANAIDDVVVGLQGELLAGGSGIAVVRNGGAPLLLTIPAPYPTSIVRVALGDLDGDGDLDLAALAIGAPDQVLLFAGDGAGTLTFSGALPLASSGFAAAMTLVDIDRDQRNDLVVVQPQLIPATQTLRIFRRTSVGALTPALFTQSADLATAGSFAQDVAAGDFDGDSIAAHLARVDLVHANVGGAGVTIRSGFTGSGFQGSASPAAGTNPIAVAVGDLDGDGNDDIAVANQGSDDVTILVTAQPALAQVYGTGCGGPTISAVGTPLLGTPAFGVRVNGAVPVAPALLLYSASSADVALAPGSCRLLVADPFISLLTFTGPAGITTYTFGVPNVPALRGMDLFFQYAVIHSPGGAFADFLDLSEALRLQLGV